jgi:50S ribosomal protein L16 3-hydroxylase
MSETAIEVEAGPRSTPLGMPARRFLARYWQRRPLLVRRAFANFRPPLDRNQLAGLACDTDASARIVVHHARGDRWELRHGPFTARAFASLPERSWTLLVQDCDKYVPKVGALLAHFDFVPRWRIDDIMVSFAADGGSVGAHVDQYDVFLLQGEGRRRWEISVDPAAPLDFRADVELKLLRHFRPTHRFVLEPGDMLYLPPGVPHHGVAVGPCMTFSVGMRAPSVAELLLDLSEWLAERSGDTQRYADPGIAPVRDHSAIDARALARVEDLVCSAQGLDRAMLGDWFGGFITRWRSAGEARQPGRALDVNALGQRLGGRRRLRRNRFSRYAWLREGRGALLFLAGQRYQGSLALARLIDREPGIQHADWQRLSVRDRATVTELYNAGHLVLNRDRS